MTDLSIAGIALVVINIAVSYKGFKDQAFFEQYRFEVEKILIYKDYKRIITGGFLHVGWLHLIFNCLSLMAFSTGLEGYMGIAQFLFVYFTALAGGSMLALYIQRHNGEYRSVGASGAVCGIIFASIALFPGVRIGFFGLPAAIPSWLYGLAYVLYAMYAIRARKDNVGHEAHLGGAATGMLVALLFRPEAIHENYLVILLILVPISIFMLLLVRNPNLLLTSKLTLQPSEEAHYTLDEKYNYERNYRQQEIDRILDKISRRGIKSLNKKEYEFLNKYSKDTV